MCLSAIAVLGTGCRGSSHVTSIEPSMEVARGSADFGLVRVGETVMQSVEVRSLTAAPVALRRVVLEGAGASSFALVDPPSDIAALGTATIEVRFAPVAEGEAQATLVIESDATDPAQATARVSLSGRGGLPHLRIEAACEPPCAGFTVVADPPSIDFGARRPLKRDSTGNFVNEPAWPTVRLVNSGAIALQVESLGFTGDAAFSVVETLPNGAFEIQPESSQSFEVRFNPTTGGSTAFAGALRVASDDPDASERSLALAGALAQNGAPRVCAAIVGIEQQDGTPGVPTNGSGVADFYGTPPPVEPGSRALVYLSAFSDHFTPGLHPDEPTRGDMSACTTDPDDGRAALRYRWTLLESPHRSLAQVANASAPEIDFHPDIVGTYRLRLEVEDAEGAKGQAEVAFDARPRRELAVQLTWGEANVDLDLHLVKPGCGGSCLFDAVGDINGFSARAAATFDWGAAGDERDDPMLVWDDQGDRGLLESIYLNGARANCAATETCTYDVYVHHFADHRVDSGSGAVCSGATCTEGAACNCAAGLGCVSGHCVAPAHPVASIFVRPAVGNPVEVTVPLDASESVALAGPCFLWHVAKVDFLPDGTAAVRPVGGAGGREFAYYGQLPDGTFSCAANGGVGQSRSYVPGVIPTYR